MTKQQQKTSLNGITRITQTLFFSCVRDSADDKSSFRYFLFQGVITLGLFFFQKKANVKWR